MMFGTCYARDGMIITSKTTYVITEDTTPDVRPMLRGPGLIAAVGLSALGIGFFDILYPGEIAAIAVAVSVSLIVGFQFAELIILNKVTRGTKQMSAAYGLESTLQKVRDELNEEINKYIDRRPS